MAFSQKFTKSGDFFLLLIDLLRLLSIKSGKKAQCRTLAKTLLAGKLWHVHCEYFEWLWPCYNVPDPTVYHRLSIYIVVIKQDIEHNTAVGKLELCSHIEVTKLRHPYLALTGKLSGVFVTSSELKDHKILRAHCSKKTCELGSLHLNG